ncbi:MAG: TIR domain-containing protein [Bacillota bacterium]
MNLKRAVCTTCGANVDVDLSSKKGVCEACGNTYLVSHAMDLDKIEIDKTKDLKNFRILLNQAIENADFETMRTQAKGILQIIPNDFKAQYYFAFASKKAHSPKALERFYNKTDFEATEEDMDEVVSHIIEQSDLSDYTPIKRFLSHHAPERSEKYEQYFNYKRKLEDNYSLIPRDAFICHRSRNRREAEAIVKTLEKDGYSCWISYRNLRPNDNENYWKNINAAIENCKVFLVVSSNDAMLSKDVQRELEIAEKMDKPKMEFKIDKAEHTSLFKHFFDGHKWIDASDDVKMAFGELKDRFFNLMQEIKVKKTKEKKETKKDKDPATTKIDNLLKRAQLSLSHNDTRQALESIEHVLDMDVETSEAWYLKFLAEHKFKSSNDFIDFLSNAADLESVIEVIESKNFSMAKKFAEDQKKFQDMVHIVQDRIDEFVETVTIEQSDAIKTLWTILLYQETNDLARFKHFLFKKKIRSVETFKAYLTDKDSLLWMERVIKSEDYQQMMKLISDETLRSYEKTYDDFRERIGEKNIAKMRKNSKKYRRIINTIDNLRTRRRFKKTFKYIKKLKNLGKEYRDEATYYSLLCRFRIKDDEAFKTFLKNPKNVSKIKRMMKHKCFKKLEKSKHYETFVNNVKNAYENSKESLRNEELKKKILRIKGNYRTWYGFSHFIVGISVLMIIMVLMSINGNITLFPIEDQLVHYFLVEIPLLLSIFLMLVTLIIREWVFYRTDRLQRKLQKDETLDKPSVAKLGIPLFVMILFILFLRYYLEILAPLHESLNGFDPLANMITTGDSLLVFSAPVIQSLFILTVFFTLLVVYSIIQTRSKKIHPAIKPGRTFRRILIRPMILVLILAIFGVVEFV